MLDANYFLKNFLLLLNILIAIFCIVIKTKPINMTDKKAKSDYIGLQLERATINAFKELCEERGSNISVELRRFIYRELKEAGK